MKKLILAAFCLLLSTFASAARNYDGCYQLLAPNTMYPAICISGTLEEGINGANVRLAIFATNTNRLQSCVLSSTVVMNNSRFEFIVDGKKELILSNFSANGQDGTATIGNTKLTFIRLDESYSQPLKQSAAQNNCL